jgi:hypothetical protein
MLILTDIQQVELQVAPKSAAGNPAPIDGAPSWSSSDDTVLTVTPDAADPTKALAVTTGKLGNARVQAQADADLGAGVVPVTAVLDIEVHASAAVTLDIAAGTPTDRPLP